MRKSGLCSSPTTLSVRSASRTWRGGSCPWPYPILRAGSESSSGLRPVWLGGVLTGIGIGVVGAVKFGTVTGVESGAVTGVLAFAGFGLMARAGSSAAVRTRRAPEPARDIRWRRPSRSMVVTAAASGAGAGLAFGVLAGVVFGAVPGIVAGVMAGFAGFVFTGIGAWSGAHDILQLLCPLSCEPSGSAGTRSQICSSPRNRDWGHVRGGGRGCVLGRSRRLARSRRRRRVRGLSPRPRWASLSGLGASFVAAAASATYGAAPDMARTAPSAAMATDGSSSPMPTREALLRQGQARSTSSGTSNYSTVSLPGHQAKEHQDE